MTLFQGDAELYMTCNELPKNQSDLKSFKWSAGELEN